jgi:23S rRNA (uracil1939-C5)-methyltransferase
MNNKNKAPVLVKRKSSSDIYDSHNRLVTNKLGHVEKFLPKDICKVLESCDSCSLLKLDYKSQILQKQNRIKQKFKELGGFFSNISVQHFVESEEKLAYRQSVKLVVSEHFVKGRQWIDIGFFRQTHNKIVDIGNCPIQNPILNDIIYYLRSALKDLQIPIYSPRKKTGLLSGLILRSAKSSKQTFVTLLVREINTSIFRQLACNLTERFSQVQGVFLQVENYESNKAVEPVLLAGTTTIEEKFGNLDFKLTNEVELPIHPNMNSKIYARILELADLNGTQTILNLYSGFGALSCLLAQNSRVVYSLDEKQNYAKNTELNLKLHGIKNVRVEVGKINSLLDNLSNTFDKMDVVIVSAPRAGVPTDVIQKIAKFSPKCILFSSSFNDQLIDDLKIFDKIKYRPVFIEPFDTHPATPYFESLTYLVPF